MLKRRSRSIRPFLRYVGGKWSRAWMYPKPRHGAIVEPFAGSAGYSLQYPHLDVTLVDADERVCGAWEFITRASAADVMALPLLEEGQFVDDVPGLVQEARWFLGFQMNVGSGPRKCATRWLLWNARVRRVLARQVHLVRHWKIVHGSYDSVDVADATYFIDPPYQRKSIYRERVGDYEALARWVRSRKGQVIVCEGDGADWLPFEPLCRSKAHPNAKAAMTGELVWHRL